MKLKIEIAEEHQKNYNTLLKLDSNRDSYTVPDNYGKHHIRIMSELEYRLKDSSINLLAVQRVLHFVFLEGVTEVVLTEKEEMEAWKDFLWICNKVL